MLDALTLDQLRTFIAAAEEGSFSAAGRRLGRAQSVVSQALANLELQLGVRLFDRQKRFPRLTDEGRQLLLEAQRVAEQVDTLKARARSMQQGLEPELSVAVDVMYPMSLLTGAVGFAQQRFPHTPLRLYVEALGGVPQLVLEGSCRLGIVGSLPQIPAELSAASLGRTELVTVVAASHPLARGRVVERSALAAEVQLVLTDRTRLSAGRDFGVLSPRTWRLADLGAKHEFLRAGFGWGNMPRHMVEQDLQTGRLVALDVEGRAAGDELLAMSVVYRKDEAPGPAGLAFIEWLQRQSLTSPLARGTKLHG